jgi:hypothetical protein
MRYLHKVKIEVRRLYAKENTDRLTGRWKSVGCKFRPLCWLTCGPLTVDHNWLLEDPGGRDKSCWNEPELPAPAIPGRTSRATESGSSDISPLGVKFTVLINRVWFSGGGSSVDCLRSCISSSGGPDFPFPVPSGQCHVYAKEPLSLGLLNPKHPGSWLHANVAIPHEWALSKPTTSRTSPLLTPTRPRASLIYEYHWLAWFAR